jgi:hypothetical protein
VTECFTPVEEAVSCLLAARPQEVQAVLAPVNKALFGGRAFSR